MQTRFVRVLTLALTSLLCLGTGSAFAQDGMEQRMQNLEERQGILATEFDRLRSLFVLPEESDYKSAYGLGPAASKIYGRERGLSLGGYGHTWLQSNLDSEEKSQWDYKRFILYVGFKFSDKLLLNSELEWEHASTSDTGGGAGSVSVEFATIDYLHAPEFNFRFGMVLVPFGFVNEIHEPPFYYGNQRPMVASQIIPTTWRENGLGFFGELAGGAVQYRLYAITSPDGSGDPDKGKIGFSKNNLRGSRQKGNRAKAEDMSVVLRLDATPRDGWLIGGSVLAGDTGHGEELTDQKIKAGIALLIWEVHAQYQYRSLHLRALYTEANIDDTDILSAHWGQGISDRLWGYYGEVAYDILPMMSPTTRMALEPFLRYERFNTQENVPAGFTPDEKRNQTVYTVGVNFYPHPNVVFKVDYRNFDSEGGDLDDDVNIGVGFTF